MATVIQRVLQLMGPLGRGKRAVQRLLGGRRPRVAVPEEKAAPLVTCVLLVDSEQVGCDAATVAACCQQVLQQNWRPLRVLVRGVEADLRRLPPMEGMLAVAMPSLRDQHPVAGGGISGGEFRFVAPLVDGYLLTVDPHESVANLQTDRIANLMAKLDEHEQLSSAGEDAAWTLSRNQPANIHSLTQPIYDAADLDCRGRLPLAGDQPFVLRFGADPDLPYRFRSWLTEPRVAAYSEDEKTAQRLALLTTRSTFATDGKHALQRLAVVSNQGGPQRMYVLRPKETLHVVLQADNFTEGGMEQVIIDLAEALHQEGFTTSLLILGTEGTAAQRARDLGLRVDNLKPDAEAYVAYLEQCGTALVNAHYSTFGADLCAARGVPFVQTMHNMYMWFGPPHIDAYRTADEHTSAYVCVSNNVARYADVTIGLSPSRMLVIPNGCNHGFRPTPEYRTAAESLRQELGLSEGAKVFLNVGSIQPPKAQHLLLAGFAQIAGEHPEAHLVFLGGPADELYYQKQLKATSKLGLEDRVHWVGRRPDVNAFHQLAVALVQPSFFEGWSLAITEAVLAELPVIATDVGGAVEQLRGTNGILLPACVPDITAIHADNLIPILEGDYPELERNLAAAMREVLDRGAERSSMPDDWPSLLRDTAYSRCAEIYHWLAAGGTAAAARYWLRPRVEAGDVTVGQEVQA